jgi:hypothetical protein
MIYTDGIHIISDISLEELHTYCARVGIKRCWFHSGSRYPHYDIPKKMRQTVLPDAKVVTSREITKILKGCTYGKVRRVSKRASKTYV